MRLTVCQSDFPDPIAFVAFMEATNGQGQRHSTFDQVRIDPIHKEFCGPSFCHSIRFLFIVIRLALTLCRPYSLCWPEKKIRVTIESISLAFDEA